MTTPTEPSGLMPPETSGTPSFGMPPSPSRPRAGGTSSARRATPGAYGAPPGPPAGLSDGMTDGLPPVPSMPPTGPESHDRALVVSGAILGGLLVVVIAVIFTAVTGVLPFAKSTPAPIPTATPTPAERVLYQAPMTTAASGSKWPGDRSWPNDDQCSQRDDGYHITNNAVCILSRYTPPPDVNISVEVKQISGLTDPSYGIAFHRMSAGNFYTFEITGSGRWYFFKELDGTISQAGGGTTSSAIHQGLNATNLLTVRISGSTYRFFVNGEQVGTGTDKSFANGQTGLDGNEQIEAVYTNFKVSQTIGS